MSDDLFETIYSERRAAREARNADKRGPRDYDKLDWQERRQEFIEGKYCVGCKAVGRGLVEATVCDHIIPRSHSNEPFLESQLQAACGHCHDCVKQKLETLYRAGRISAADLKLTSRIALQISRQHPPPQFRGVDVEGRVRDPAHLWYRGGKQVKK